MSSGIASLHKILKDESRRNIILLLNEKGSLSYTKLLDASETGSTGLLNYQLKVLGDLLTKNEAGQYVLSEKGKLAYRLLEEFPPGSNQPQKRKRQRQFWTVAALSQIVYLITIITLYYLRYVDFGRLVLYTVWFIGAIGLAYLGYRMQGKVPASGSKEEKSRFKKAYILLGGWIGLVLAFFGTVFLTFLSVRLGGPKFIRIINEPWEFSVLVVLGAITGYCVGKRNNFEKPKWMDKIDEKFGF
jgi:hypothetical protein